MLAKAEVAAFVAGIPAVHAIIKPLNSIWPCLQGYKRETGQNYKLYIVCHYQEVFHLREYK